MNVKTNIETGNLVVYFKENYVNPINKEVKPIEVTCEINKNQLETLSRFNVDIVSHTSKILKSEYKKIKRKNIYEALLNKANKHINFYDIKKVLSDDKRYFITGALEDIIPFVINNDVFNDVFINKNKHDLWRNPTGILGNFQIGNKKVYIVYLNYKIENSCLLLSTMKDYDNTYKITF